MKDDNVDMGSLEVSEGGGGGGGGYASSRKFCKNSAIW